MSKCGLCAKCKRWHEQLTDHHIYPRRFYPGSTQTISLCWNDHCSLEAIIAKRERKGGFGRHCLSKRAYFEILSDWLQ
jgi:hypothetical protein